MFWRTDDDGGASPIQSDPTASALAGDSAGPSASPGAALAIDRMAASMLDIRPVLPDGSCPDAGRIHRIADTSESVEQARYIGESNPGAKVAHTSPATNTLLPR